MELKNQVEFSPKDKYVIELPRGPYYIEPVYILWRVFSVKIQTADSNIRSLISNMELFDLNIRSFNPNMHFFN